MPVRIKMDRHCLWHPREDYEIEASNLNAALNELADRIKAEMIRSLNGRWSRELNPDGIRYSNVKDDVGSRTVKWVDLAKDYIIDVEVLLAISPRPMEEETPPRTAVRRKR